MAQSDRIAGLASFAIVAAQVMPLPLPAIAAIGVAPVAAQYGARPVNVTCYSSGNRTSTCDLPRDTQSVTYVGPDRSNRCREGETWRRRGNQIQVSGGCGGIFEAMVYQGGGQGGSWGGGNNNQGFAGETTCRSRNNRPEQCAAPTQNRVQLLQQYSSSPCIEGRTWSYNRNRIQVRDGCQARFGYGYGNWNGGGSGGNWGGGNQGFANQTECKSENFRYRRCTVNTQNRVELLRELSSSNCVQGRSWGYDNRSIWVDNGCQARFGYGYGNVSGDRDQGNNGSNTAAIIGGAALAAGLIALLASSGRKSTPAAASTTSARIDADMNRFPADARTSADACMAEAARQVGSTAGTAVRLDQVDSAQRSGEGWIILARLTATYDGKPQPLSMDCRATGNKVTAFEVR